MFTLFFSPCCSVVCLVSPWSNPFETLDDVCKSLTSAPESFCGSCRSPAKVAFSSLSSDFCLLPSLEYVDLWSPLLPSSTIVSEVLWLCLVAFGVSPWFSWILSFPVSKIVSRSVGWECISAFSPLENPLTSSLSVSSTPGLVLTGSSMWFLIFPVAMLFSCSTIGPTLPLALSSSFKVRFLSLFVSVIFILSLLSVLLLLDFSSSPLPVLWSLFCFFLKGGFPAISFPFDNSVFDLRYSPWCRPLRRFFFWLDKSKFIPLFPSPLAYSKFNLLSTFSKGYGSSTISFSLSWFSSGIMLSFGLFSAAPSCLSTLVPSLYWSRCLVSISFSLSPLSLGMVFGALSFRLLVTALSILEPSSSGNNLLSSLAPEEAYVWSLILSCIYRWPSWFAGTSSSAFSLFIFGYVLSLVSLTSSIYLWSSCFVNLSLWVSLLSCKSSSFHGIFPSSFVSSFIDLFGTGSDDSVVGLLW